MGAEGIVVDKLEDVGPALKKAVDMQMNQGKTTVIEIMCTRELGDPFRRDARSRVPRGSVAGIHQPDAGTRGFGAFLRAPHQRIEARVRRRRDGGGRGL
jgi:hypothetical protein